MTEDVTILVGHTWCAIYKPTSLVTRLLQEALTVKETKWFMGEPETEYHLFYEMSAGGNLVFLTGLLNTVIYKLEGRALTHKLVDQRKWSITPAGAGFTGSLVQPCRPYQQQAVDAMLYYKRGIIHAATNAGKTYIMGGFWHALGRPTMLIIVPTRPLLKQVPEDLEKQCGLRPGTLGRVGDGKANWKPVTVAIGNSASDYADAAGKLPIDFSVLMVDEGDTFVGSRAKNVCNALANTPYRFWLTGTPFKDKPAHDWKMVGYAGSVINKITNEEMIEGGHSKKPMCLFVDNQLQADMKGGFVMDVVSTWDEAYTAYIAASTHRAWLVAVIAQIAQTVQLNTLIFTEHIKHAEIIEKQVAEVGGKAIVIHGKHKSEAHDEAIKLMKTNKGVTVIATGTWRRGLSIPSIDVLINAAGRKAIGLVGQQLGRLLRASDQPHGFYIDFFDKGHRTLHDHALKRMKFLQREGLDVAIWQPDKTGMKLPTIEDVVRVAKATR